MKKEIRECINRYKDLWERMEGYDPVISKESTNNSFFVRHHSAARSDILEKSWFSEYTDEMYDSVSDCLACFRWYVIPERLREVSGLLEETDLEILLDNAGYSASLIAEELFSMIDKCLESGSCSDNDLHRIRLAYNGLSGYQDDIVRRIAQWGPHYGIMYPDTNASGVSGFAMSIVRNPYQEALYSGFIGKPSKNTATSSITGVFAG